jgi:hypothetical protein
MQGFFIALRAQTLQQSGGNFARDAFLDLPESGRCRDARYFGSSILICSLIPHKVVGIALALQFPEEALHHDPSQIKGQILTPGKRASQTLLPMARSI